MGSPPEHSPWRPTNVAGGAGAATDTAATPRYLGRRWALFWIALGRALITILTFGVGRFWMITRLRRHFWSSIEIDGAPLEYTGRAGEKLIGFLVAVVILAAYLMVVNLGLTFVGLSYFQGNPLALQLPLLALIPFIPWARYRARRYILARTRWRGIRFGMAPGAWGYALRSLWWSFLTYLTLGFLYPLMQMKLSRYTTERSFFGDLRFEQRGSWTPLLKSWLLVWLPLPVLMIVAGLWAAAASGGSAFDSFGAEDGAAEASPAAPAAALPLDDPMVGLFVGLGLFLLYVWLMFAWMRHQVFSFRYLNSNKVLGGRTWFEFRLGTWRVIGIYFAGGMAILLGVALFAIAGVTAAGALLPAFGVQPPSPGAVFEGDPLEIDGMTALAAFLAAYLPAVAAAMALSQAFISHPLIAEAAATTRIRGLAHAERARQRSHDRQAEAGGFADALGADIGGAF